MNARADTIRTSRKGSRHDAESPTLAAALSYAARSWGVIPICAGQKAPPMTARGHRDATTDAGTVLRWFSAHPKANVGIATGSASRLLVVDLDVYKEPGALKAFEAEHGTTKTYTVRTARGGVHLYYMLGPQQTARCRGERDGICIKADGGYVVAPPSSTPDGDYTLLDPRKPAKAPQTLCRTDKAAPPHSAPGATPQQADKAPLCYERTTSETQRLLAKLSGSLAELASSFVADGPHQNHSVLFAFVRGLKAWELRHDRLASCDKAEAFDVWFAESGRRGVLRKELTRDAYWSEYLRAWATAKFAMGESLEPYLLRAESEPLPPEATYFNGTEKRLLLALCYQLHLAADGGQWFVPGKTGARLILGTESKQTTISQWLREFVGLGVLEVVQRHTAVKATRFRYIPQKPVTSGEIEPK